MNAGFTIDFILAAALIAGAVVGAKRGLFKSLMGLVVVAAALIGASLLANALTQPLTDQIAPKIEDEMVERFAAKLDALTPGEETDAAEEKSLIDALREDGLSEDTIKRILEPVTAGLGGVVQKSREAAIEAYRAAISGVVYSLVSSVVHAALLLVLYVVLLFVLRLLVRALDRVFDLPVLGTLNGFGGALLGFLEAYFLLFVALNIASRLGISWLDERLEDSRLLPFFLRLTPIGFPGDL